MLKPVRFLTARACAASAVLTGLPGTKRFCCKTCFVAVSSAVVAVMCSSQLAQTAEPETNAGDTLIAAVDSPVQVGTQHL